MDKVKSILASRTIITNFVTFLATVLVIWGIEMTPEQQAGVVTLMVGLGTALSSFFRATATKQVVVAGPGTAKSMNDLKVTKLLFLLAFLPFLGACVTAQPAVVVTPGGNVTKADLTVYQASEQVARYCGVLRFAVGVGQMFAKQPNHLVYVQRAQAAVVTYCDNPPTDVYSALSLLAVAYRNIMAVPAVRVEVAAAKLQIR